MEEESGSEKTVGRNEPCPCGSGKKYKRCCGVSAAPKLGPPKALPMGMGGPGGAPGGFDPSQMDPQMMMQLSQALQRLPRGQMQRLQGIMQKAMSGQDVTREAGEFEKTLPAEFKSMLAGLQMPGMMGAPGELPAPGDEPMAGGGAETGESGMTADEARAIVEKAAAEGKISQEQAETVLSGAPKSEEEKSKVSKFWRSITGKS